MSATPDAPKDAPGPSDDTTEPLLGAVRAVRGGHEAALGTAAEGPLAPPPGDPSVVGDILRCARCRYDLAGTAPADGAVCPECGHTLDAMASLETREQDFFRRFGGWIAGTTAVTLLVIAGILLSTGERVALFAIPLVLIVVCWLPFLVVARMARDID